MHMALHDRSLTAAIAPGTLAGLWAGISFFCLCATAFAAVLLGRC